MPRMEQITFADHDIITKYLPFGLLIEQLEKAFSSETIVTPIRHHHDFKNPGEGLDSTLLLMPSWLPGSDLGVKVVTVSPNNTKYDLPSIQGLYVLLDAHKGTPRLLLDARELTARRTAATSALASKFLSREDSDTLFMIGTGTLAPHLIQAHATVRNLKQVWIWGRDLVKAQIICDQLANQKFNVGVTPSIKAGLEMADIVSCATLSAEALVLGKDLKEGQHIDLVGAYKKDMREADDAVILRSNVYIDSPTALKETGDLVIPLSSGVLDSDDIRGNLFQLCQKKCNGRSRASEITLFKSVGHALEDLVAAQTVYEALVESSDFG